MNKKTVISYCMSMGLLVSTTGCNNEQNHIEEIAKPVEQQAAPVKPQEQNSMENPNIITTPSGLQYSIIEPSKIQNAQEAKPGDKVSVHYTGWLQENGKKFDSSRDRNQPFTFTLGARQVIAGWDEGVKGMKQGEKRRLIIPAPLAYGNRAVGGDLIPANSTLIFEVELLDINK